MPCYHFTYHAYGTWLPDQPDGYVQRDKGPLPQDTKMAVAYRKRMTDDEVKFDSEHQQAIIDEVRIAVTFQSCRLHFIATESTHVHVLVSWQDDLRSFEKPRSAIRQSISRRLSRGFENRQWLSEGSSRRKVVNQEHYDYLICTYLPQHTGWKWSEERGLHK
jgi:hypothetical protein